MIDITKDAMDKILDYFSDKEEITPVRVFLNSGG